MSPVPPTMTVREFLPGDYEMFELWCAQHGQQAPQWEEVSDQRGLIIEDGGGPVAGAFLFQAGRHAIIEGLATRPGIGVRRAWEACSALGECLEAIAQAGGAKKVAAFVSSKGMVRCTERAGYVQQGPPMAQMIKTLEP